MSNTSERLAEIRWRLEATNGRIPDPWFNIHAPADIAYLLSEIDRLESEKSERLAGQLAWKDAHDVAYVDMVREAQRLIDEWYARRNFWKAAAKGMYHRSITAKYWDMDMGEVIAERDALRLALAEATGGDPGETDGENVHTALLQALEMLDHQDERIERLTDERDRYAVALESIARYLGVNTCKECKRDGCTYADQPCNDYVSDVIDAAELVKNEPTE